MSDNIPPESISGAESVRKVPFRSFKDIASFSWAIKLSTGLAFDLEPLMELHTDFIQATDKYLLLNIKE